MTAACVFLLLIAALGAFDVAYFHTWRGALISRPECRRENLIHVARGVNYAAQLFVVPNLALRGAWYAALVALFAIDFVIGFADILEEPRSRAAQGGLSGGEYLMHMSLSVLVGAELWAIASGSFGWSSLPTAIVLEPHGPLWLRASLAVFGIGSALVAALEALGLALSGPPRPIHVRVRIATSLDRLWELTQDHRLHPAWDHRFDRIELETGEAWTGAGPDPRIRTGTRMRYEKDVLGLTIGGFGRYKLHKPMRQSTFEFWSDDPRSLIRRGVGLWLYTPLTDGRVEFATSYTYEVRYGWPGRVFDRLVFRPLFQRVTEQSFARLAREHFDAEERVLGADGRRPARFLEPEFG